MAAQGEFGKPAFLKKRAPTLYAIIAIKLSKGLLLLLLGLGVYTLLDKNLPQQFRETVQFLHLDPEKKFFTILASKIAQVTPTNIIWVARGTVLYSLFSLVEGVGLVFRAPWAGWMVKIPFSSVNAVMAYLPCW